MHELSQNKQGHSSDTHSHRKPAHKVTCEINLALFIWDAVHIVIAVNMKIFWMIRQQTENQVIFE